MCGRYQLQVSSAVLRSSHPNTTWHDSHDIYYQPRQQVFPSNSAPVFVAKSNQSALVSPLSFERFTSPKELLIMKWGFKKYDSPSNLSRPLLINARRETLLDLPTFRRVLKSRDKCRRCAIPITAFYEWHKSPPPGKKVLTPYLVHRNERNPSSDTQNSVTFLAGIYEKARAEEADNYTFVIVTTASASDFSWLHSRQPVFLSTERHFNLWLDPNVSAEDAVASLNAESGLVCVRMLKDLSAPAPIGAEKKQQDIFSFFRRRSPPKSNPANTKLVSENCKEPEKQEFIVQNSGKDRDDKSGIAITKSLEKGSSCVEVTLKPAHSIQKKNKGWSSASPHRRKGQKQISSFFCKKQE